MCGKSLCGRSLPLRRTAPWPLTLLRNTSTRQNKIRSRKGEFSLVSGSCWFVGAIVVCFLWNRNFRRRLPFPIKGREGFPGQGGFRDGVGKAGVFLHLT